MDQTLPAVVDAAAYCADHADIAAAIAAESRNLTG